MVTSYYKRLIDRNIFEMTTLTVGKRVGMVFTMTWIALSVSG